MKRKILAGMCIAPLFVCAVACGNTTNANQSEKSSSTATSSSTASAPTLEPGFCENTYGDWDMSEDSTETKMVKGTIDSVRMGDFACIERVVVDVDTKEKVGFHAKYVPVVLHEGSGFPVEVEGEATLQLVIDAQFALTPNGMPAFYTTPEWGMIQEIRSAGSFEGQTTLAIGLSSKAKFGVYHGVNDDGRTTVFVDIVKPFK